MKKQELFIQEICSDCLQWIVNNENCHTRENYENMVNTLTLWAKDKYLPAGLTDNEEPFFSWQKCELCDCLPGDRYEYYFKTFKK